MNAKLIVAIVLTVVMLAGGIWEMCFVEKTFDSFYNQLQMYIDRGYTLNDLNRTLNWWTKKSKIIEVTIPYTQLIEISVTFGELIGATEREDFDSANALINRIQEYVAQLKHMYGANFGHII